MPVVVTRVVVAAEARPMLAHQRLDRTAAHREHVEPEQDRPQPVLLAQVVGAGAVALFAAQRGAAGVEQVAEELPAGRCLETRDAQGLRDAVGRGGGGHRARDASQARLVARRDGGVRGEHGEAVRGRDREVAADDHVAVRVAVGRAAQVGRIRRCHVRDQIFGVDRVRVGMQLAEVLQRLGVDHAARRRAQFALEDGPRVRTADRAHRIAAHAEAAREEAPDRLEVEYLAHQRGMVGYRVDHLDRGALDLQLAETVDVQRRSVADAVGLDRLGAREHRLGELLGRRAAVADVVLDAEVALGAARVVAGREHDAAAGPVLADHAAHRRCRQDAAEADQHAAKALRRRHAQDGLHRDPVVEAPVAAQHQGLAVRALEHVEQRLHEVLQVVRLAELRHLLAQARGAGLLAGKGLGRHADDRHRRFSCWRAVRAFRAAARRSSPTRCGCRRPAR